MIAEQFRKPGAGSWNSSGGEVRIFLCWLLASCLWLLVPGCKSATEAGHNSALDATDLVKMTDDMTMKLLASPNVKEAIAREGKLRVVVQPVENMMTAEVLPKGPAEAFTARLRGLLATHAPNQFTWIMNRDAFYSLRGRELDGMDLGPSPEVINPEYALTAKFSSLASEDSKRRSSYYLCVYELTSLRDRTLLWSDRYEVKKNTVKGFLD